MKLAFSTLPCMDYDENQLFDLCEKYGFCGAEVRTKSDNTFTAGGKLKLTDVGSGICIKRYSEGQLETGRKILELMKEYDVPAMRVFLGNFAQKYDAQKEELNHAEIVKMLQELCDMSDREIWIETHNEYATGKVLSKLLAEVDRDNCKIIWDIIHPFEDGETPKKTIDYLGDKIAHVHIKDGKKHADPIWHDYEYTPLGEGVLPISEIVHLLEENGYKGCYSLEWESLWRNELKELNWSVDEILSKFVEFMKDI